MSISSSAPVSKPAPRSAALLRSLRQLHLYVGLFIAPALIFFAFTGALQTFSLHESGHGRANYTPPGWIVTLAQIHKDQNIVTRKPRPAARPAQADGPGPQHGPAATAAPPSTPGPSPAGPQPHAPEKEKSHLPLKIFFLLVACSLIISTVTGIYMAFKYGRSRLLIFGALLAGIVIPLVLLPF